MNKRNLFARLKQLGEDAQRLTGYTLNSGGCCVYAALVGEELEKLGITVEGKVTTRSDLSLDEAKNESTWPNNYNFYHVYLYFTVDGTRYVYDSDNLHEVQEGNGAPDPWQDEPAEGSLSIAEMQALASKASLWNSWFPRRKIPALRKLVHEELAPLNQREAA